MPKIEELRIIANSANVTNIGISESKLNESVLEPEIQYDNYKIIRCDRKRQRGGVACYIRNDLSYNTVTVYPHGMGSVFLEICYQINNTSNNLYLISSFQFFGKTK